MPLWGRSWAALGPRGALGRCGDAPGLWERSGDALWTLWDTLWRSGTFWDTLGPLWGCSGVLWAALERHAPGVLAAPAPAPAAAAASAGATASFNFFRISKNPVQFQIYQGIPLYVLWSQEAVEYL